MHTDKKLVVCHQCGSYPKNIEWSDLSEYHNISEKSVDISCSGTKRINCPVQVSISLDVNFKHEPRVIEDKLTKMWNNLNE